jgi:hypothetical protein
MKSIRVLILGLLPLLFALPSPAADPRLSSWRTGTSGQYARVRETDASAAAGATTWTGQTLPAYCDVQEIASDANYIYVRSYGLAGYVMGPWYLNAARTQLFPNRPLAANRYRRLARNPAPAASKTATGLGAIGMYVNGVSLFDNRDAFYWNGSAEANGNGYWNRDAWVNEGVTFDFGYAHQEQTGNYHYHAFPPALRYQLGDNVSYNPATFRYSEDTNNLHHSPILAWVADGFPIYGPYGYADATNTASGVRRIVSGFVPRNGQKGTDNLTGSGRTTIPAWAQRAYGVGPNPLAGPAVSAQYPLGRYLEDNAYLGDLTNAATGQRYQLGVDFDLNEYNVRWCVTPEFPGGTWAYFCSLNVDGTPAFPYAVGRQFWGTPDNTAITTIPAGSTNFFTGGPDSRLALKSPARAGSDVVLTWSSVEGGTYRVEGSTHVVAGNWTAVQSNIVATGSVAQATETGGASSPSRYYRVTRTALASYYGSGTTTNGGGGNGILSVSPTSAARGATFTLTVNIDPAAQPAPPPQNAPVNSVTIGTIAGTSRVHVSAAQVTASFTIPAGAATGPQTVTVIFPGPPGNPTQTVTYTLPNGFTIN